MRLTDTTRTVTEYNPVIKTPASIVPQLLYKLPRGKSYGQIQTLLPAWVLELYQSYELNKGNSKAGGIEIQRCNSRELDPERSRTPPPPLQAITDYRRAIGE